ncbi:membrane protein insertase YidC [Candidatus Riflebacteria bacterium]
MDYYKGLSKGFTDFCDATHSARVGMTRFKFRVNTFFLFIVISLFPFLLVAKEEIIKDRVGNQPGFAGKLEVKTNNSLLHFDRSKGIIDAIEVGYQKKYPMLLSEILSKNGYMQNSNGELPASGFGCMDVNGFGFPKTESEILEKVNSHEENGKRILSALYSHKSLRIKKSYYISLENDYQIGMKVEFENVGTFPMQLGSEGEPAFSLSFGPLLDYPPPYRQDFFKVSGEDTFESVYLKSDKNAGKNQNVSLLNVQGAGLKTNYYAFIIRGKNSKVQQHYKIEEVKLESSVVKSNRRISVYFLSLQIPTTILSVGQKKSFEFRTFCGQKEEKTLGKFGMPGLSDFGFISRSLLSVLSFFYSWYPNWGVAIILLTLTIKLILHPLTAKQTENMLAMQKIQPKQNELREKYKDDPQKLNAELIKLFKENNVNPLGGCLPLIIQLPIFIALFTTLQSAVQLKGAPFYFWITDLSKADPLFIFPFLVAVSMKLQMSETAGNDPVQTSMMTYMPVLMFFIAMNLPSGVLVYWLITNITSIIHQRAMANRRPELAGKQVKT